jgi:L-alanine-DL-glutamate epimerase-like enolase superfamily enzyme
VVGAALREGAVDILQTDVGWSGISEVQRISALAAHFGVPIYPHGAGWLPGLQVAAAQPPEAFRAIEHHVSLARERTYFLKDPPVPRGGAFDLPAGVGLGLEIDASKVAHRRVLTERWAAPSARGDAP